ncbi:MAG: DUF975 family protein [Acutalibacteraceae bacterium]|nr:DUF975 family protein [Acutalibacteraceae bacterium]
MASSKAVKATALAILKGNWGNAVAMAMIPFCASVIAYLIGSLLSLPMGTFSAIIVIAINLILCAPLWLGAIRCYWRMANDVKDGVSEVFYYFSDVALYKRTLFFSLRLFLLVALGIVVVFIPALAVDFVTSESFYTMLNIATPLWVLNLNFISGILGFLGFAASIAYVICFFLAAFVFVTRDDIEPSKCIREGMKMAKYTKNTFSSYVFSFLGWILLSLFFVPVIFTAPYMLMAYTVGCRFAVASYNRIIESKVKIPTHEV